MINSDDITIVHRYYIENKAKAIAMLALSDMFRYPYTYILYYIYIQIYIGDINVC